MVLSFLLINLVISVYLKSANEAKARVKTQTHGNQQQNTCPDGDGWTKVDSGNLSTYPVPGAIEYCFKAGSFITNEIPEGGFGQSGGCSEENPENCNLSHWSYRSAFCPVPSLGDVVHYENGSHQIVGGGLLEGSDDVYTLSDGNYLQCFCGLDGQGIQTFWWRTSIEELDGWFSLNGLQWNLGNYHYLAQNSLYDCSN